MLRLPKVLRVLGTGLLLAALVAVLAVGAQIGYFLYAGKDSFKIAAAIAPNTPAAGNVEQIADSLFSDYLLPFEIESILLLVAVVGSVVMAKKRI